MAATPTISVVMSVYKEPLEWLRQSIDSILNQTFNDFEFIIISDNPSYDEGIALLKDYAGRDSRIVLIFNQENIGLTKSLNKGLTIAKGQYIARMDADDISMPERFEKQIRFLAEHPNVGVCGTAIRIFGTEERPKSFPLRHEDVYMFIENPFVHSSIMLRSSCLKDGAKYNETCLVAQDYVFWNDLYSRGIIFANLNEPLVAYRKSSAQISSTKYAEQMRISRETRRAALTHYLKLKHIEYYLPDTVRWCDVHTLPRLLELPPDVDATFRFYLYISKNSNALTKIAHLLFYGDIFKINPENIIRILYFQVAGKAVDKY